MVALLACVVIIQCIPLNFWNSSIRYSNIKSAAADTGTEFHYRCKVFRNAVLFKVNFMGVFKQYNAMIKVFNYYISPGEIQYYDV